MSLTTYRKKRRFNQTPEPQGGKTSDSGPLTFVVQRHQASQLHYDFRLELDGVLKSWAVPKGPSLNPDDRRLAMMVEDHPMDYADFEGIIPKGNYGAGTVMVWDTGVYCSRETVDRTKSEKILAKQLAEGHITIVMFGKKLKGEFALVRSPKAGDNAWLLIKKHDEYASKDDILRHDKSVLTGRTMSQIKNQAEKKKEIWQSRPKDLDLNDAPKSPFPHKIKPMLSYAINEPFDRADWLFEVKWDGYRAIAEIQAGKVNLYSRNLQSYNEKFAPIAKSLERFPGKAVLDGEVVVVDEQGHPKFQWLQDYPKTGQGELIYYVFDMLHFDGHNLEKLPLRQRKELLQQVLPTLPHIAYSDHIEQNGKAFFREASKLGLEGIMAKNAESVYRFGVRTHEWLKIKTHLRQEAIIAGYTKPRGGRKHFGALVLGLYKRGKLTYIGHTGGGFDDDLLASVLAKLKPLEQEDCPFETRPKTNAPVTWVKPTLVCEVSFASWTKDQQMRQPIFMGLRQDKPAPSVAKETTFSPDPPKDESTTELSITKRKVKVTNLSKVFWPKEGYTKGDLIDYYRAVAPAILPHLKNRPESLLRYPHGVTGGSFFQKDASTLTSNWMKTTMVASESHGKDIEYLLCQDEASLVYLINLGCIDLNPWNSRVGHLDNPDYVIIDLDPEAIGFSQVVKVAQATRDVLESLDIEGYPKTSGARGMHIYIPMGAKYPYEQVRKFAELLCVHIQAKVPQITSMVRNPKERQGKVYLDYLQNARGQTLASVYSVRAQPGATVSTPLKWSEVTAKLHPSQFTINNIPKRLQTYGDLFMPVLGKGVNIQTTLKKFGG